VSIREIRVNPLVFFSLSEFPLSAFSYERVATLAVGQNHSGATPAALALFSLMNSPGWYCERCETPVPEISPECDADPPLRCPHCKKHCVVWMTPATEVERRDAIRAQDFSPAIKTEQAGLDPAIVQAGHATAAHWFTEMRRQVDAAPDAIPVCPSGTTRV